VSHNVERSVEAAFDSRRVDLVVMQKGKPLGLDSEFGEYFVQETAKFPEVDRVSEGVVGNANVIRDSGTVDDNITLIQGWRPDNFGYEDLDVIQGRRLQAGDHYKVMLGRILADNLKKKVGDKITFVGEPDHPYEVIGIFKSRVVFEEGGGIVPFEDGQVLHTKPGKVTGFSVRVKRRPGDEPTAVVAEVKRKIEALRDPKQPQVTLTADSPDKYVQSVSQLQLIRAVTWLVSAIALAVSVISLVNTMTMSVLERTQEIGILRAVGWPRARVIRMILGEAAALAAAAAVTGSVLAFVGMQTLTLMPKVNGFIEPDLAPVVVVRGFALTVLVGVIGGAYPAYRAAKLLPTEALRHD
jgi:putative ABC transport system permease protein